MTLRSGAAVPIARAANGSLVRPDDAERGTSYTCPGCGEAVVLRVGDRRRAHFAHRRASCAPDSALHRSAKAVVLEVIASWKAGTGPRPCISRSCARFGCDGGVVQDMPEDVTEARTEVRLASGLIGDVVLYRGDDPAVAVELLVTSRVTEEKAARFQIPWVELDARELLDRPYWWVAVQDGLHPFPCPACERRNSERRSRLGEIYDAARRLTEESGFALWRGRDYHPVPHTCWRCSAAIVVYVWRGGGRHSGRRPPDPIPPTVQHRVTEGAGNYWANCCPVCSAVQGDYYLVERNSDYALVKEAFGDPYATTGDRESRGVAR